MTVVQNEEAYYMRVLQARVLYCSTSSLCFYRVILQKTSYSGILNLVDSIFHVTKFQKCRLLLIEGFCRGMLEAH